MRIGVTGATGFIGGRLCEYLSEQGYHIDKIGRDLLRSATALQAVVDNCDAIINIAGAPIGRRWSSEYKKELLNSRIQTTREIVDAINNSSKCRILISASAIGYYPSKGCYDEYSQRHGKDFLANLCSQWEEQAQLVKPSVRLVIARFGIVLAPNGGALRKLVMSQRLQVITIPGRGDYHFSWIDREDLVRAMEFIIENKSANGIFNLTVPESLTLRQFMLRFAEYNHSWLFISIPQFFIRWIYGEAADFFMKGQCIYPQKLLECGFKFRSPDVAHFLQKKLIF